MSKTLYDIIDSWTMNWDRSIIEITLDEVSDFFYRCKLVFFLLEEIWDILEFIDDPFEFMTEDRKKQQIENLLRSERNELAAKFVKLDVIASPEFQITVLNAEETIAQHPDWFTPLDEGISTEDDDTNPELD